MVVQLLRGEITSKKVWGDFFPGNMDVTGSRKKSPYQQVKDYVSDHAGLNEDSFYAVQAMKCGIRECANYNLPKTLAAIRDALKHFGMK